MIRIFYRGGSEQAAKSLQSAVQTDLLAGGKVIMLLPEQEAVSAERRWLELLPPSAQLHFEVLNFTRLANRVFREVGGLCYHYATKGIEFLFMRKVLRESAPALLQYGEDAVKDPRLCDKMLSAVAQFKAYCIPPELLLQAADTLGKNDPFYNKLADLGLIYANYEKALNEKYDNVKDDLTRLANALTAHKHLLADTHIYIDSFTDFTAQELAVIKILMARAPSLSVVLPLPVPFAESIALETPAATEKKLMRMAKESGKNLYTVCDKEEKPKTALEKLRKDLFELSAEPAPLAFCESNEIYPMVCPTFYEEAELAAATVGKLVREGCRYKDIAVVVRDASLNGDVLAAAFEKENIPFYLSEKTDITQSPLIKLILFSLFIKKRDWQYEDLISCLKTGLFGLPVEDINLFEEYCTAWNLNGYADFHTAFTRNPDGYTETVSDRGLRILEAANRVRATVTEVLDGFCKDLSAAKTTTELCRAAYTYLVAAGIPDRLKESAAAALANGNRREAEEENRLFSTAVEALEQLNEVLGEEKPDVGSFIDALRLIFANTDIGSIPTSSDEVLIGSASTLRAGSPRFALVLGLNDGLFPQNVKESGLLSDNEKHRLEALNITLSADSTATASDELFYVLRAFSLPRERLYLSYAERNEEGKKTEPSFAISRLTALFPTLQIRKYEAQDILSFVYSPAAALDRLPKLNECERNAVLSLSEEYGKTDFAKRCAIPFSDTAAFVSPEKADKCFDAGSFNPTGIENFNACHFGYYCDKILKLRKPPKDSLDASVAGIFMHYVFENVFRKVKESNRTHADYSSGEIEALVAECVENYKAELIKMGGALTPRAEALTERLAVLARLVVQSLFADFKEKGFRPARFELNLADLGEFPYLRLSDGNKIPLSGKIDRLDYYRSESGNAFVGVVDYKTGDKSFDREDIANGFSLQMPLYLYALCHGKHPALAKELGTDGNTDFLPAGVTYVSTNVETDSTDHPESEAEAFEKVGKRLKKAGLQLSDPETDGAMPTAGKQCQKVEKEDFNELFADLEDTVERIYAEMKSGNADALPNEKCKKSPCAYCNFFTVCRAAKKEEKGGKR